MLKGTPRWAQFSGLGCVTAIVLLCGLAALQALFDPLAWLLNLQAARQLQQALPAAASRWQAQQITAYTVEVKGAVPLRCFIDATLTVKDNQLVGVLARKNPLLPASALEPVAPADWDTPNCSYQKLLAAEMFGRVAQALGRLQLSEEALRVKFDPVYGFVQSYTEVFGYRRGLLTPVVTDSTVWYTFSHFQPLTPTVTP